MTTVKLVGAAHTSAFPVARRLTRVWAEHSTAFCHLARRFPNHRYLGDVDSDVVAESLELAHGVSLEAFGVTAGVVVGSWVVVEGAGVGHGQMLLRWRARRRPWLFWSAPAAIRWYFADR